MKRTARMAMLLLALAASAAAQPSTPMVTFRAEARLVEVYATVLDRSGRYVDEVPAEQFRVLDNGAPQPLVSFENSSTQLSCAILLDTTASMTAALPRVKNATYRLVDDLREHDWAAAYTFDNGLDLLQDFTQDKSAVKRALARTRAEGGTALFDAISRVSTDLAGRRGKKVVVVFTDGDDNASLLTGRKAADAAKKLGVPVYVAAEGEALRSERLMAGLKELARLTGGKTYAVKKLNEVSDIFQDISEELRHTYLLTYKAPEGRNGDWRQIQVSLASSNYNVRAKEGYFGY